MRLRAAAFFLPALAIVCAGGFAGVLPEDVLWLNAGKALLLSLTRWLGLGWLVAAAVLWRARDRRGAIGAFLPLLCVVGLPPLGPEGGAGLLVVSANVQAYAEDTPALEAALGALHPDVVFTFERRAEQIPGLVRVADNHDRPMPRPSHGSAIFCREGLDCAAEVTEEFGAPGCAMPISLARVGGLCLVGVHVPPPVPLCAEGTRPYVAELTAHIEAGVVVGGWRVCAPGDPVLVFGDLNGVPGGESHRALVQAGLRDPLLPRGLWGMSWPAGGGWPNFPFFRIDHLLVGATRVEDVRQLRLPAADHKALRFRVTDVKSTAETGAI